MAFVYMPVDIGIDEIVIKEVIKRWDAMDVVMKIPKIAFKVLKIGSESTEALTERCWPSRNDRSGGPCLKLGEDVLKGLGPMGICQIGAIVLADA